MKYLILPVLRFLNLLFACGSCLFICPWLLIWFFNITDTKRLVAKVFYGIIEYDPEIYCPAGLFAFMLSPLWLLKPLIVVLHFFGK